MTGRNDPLRSLGIRSATSPALVVSIRGRWPFRSVARTLIGMIRGWRVLGEAESGEDGVAQVAALGPAVVLMDINLPGINGVEATRRIVADHPDVAVVLLSTYAAEDLPADAQSCGAAGYIRKDDLTPKLLKSVIAPAA